MRDQPKLFGRFVLLEDYKALQESEAAGWKKVNLIEQKLRDLCLRNQRGQVSNADAMSEIHEHYDEWFQVNDYSGREPVLKR